MVPNNTVVAVVGDFDTDKVIAGIKKRTAEWKATNAGEAGRRRPAGANRGSPRRSSDPAAAQLTVYLRHLGVKRNNRFYKLIVMDNILGPAGSRTGCRRTCRRPAGTGVLGERPDRRQRGREPERFTGYIGTFPDKFAEVRAGFLKEIHRIRDDLPDKDEVEAAKNY